jgi:hypothetical protein
MATTAKTLFETLFDQLGTPPGGSGSFVASQVPGGSVSKNQNPIAPAGSAYLSYFDPYERPIPGAVEFNAVGQTGIILIPSGFVTIGLIDLQFITPITGNGPLFTIPQGNLARISGYTLYQQDTDETLNYWPIYYTLQLNSAPVPGYSNLPYYPRTSALLANTFTPYLRVQSGQAVTINVKVLNGGGLSLPQGKAGAAISGWYWSQTADVAWKQQFGVPVDASEQAA